MPPSPSSSPLRIRPATLDDMQAVVDIYNETVVNTTATYEYEPRPLDAQRAMLSDKQRDGFPMFVATDANERVLGFSTYGAYRPRPGWRFTVEHSVYVALDARGQGLGPLLMTPIIEHAQARGYHSMVGVIDAANAQSMAMHRKCGFEVAGILRQGGFKFGRWLDVAIVQRML